MSKRAGSFNVNYPNLRGAGAPVAQAQADQPAQHTAQAPAWATANRAQSEGLPLAILPADLPPASTAAQPVLHSCAAPGLDPGHANLDKRDWPAWLNVAQHLQNELAAMRASWQNEKDFPHLLTPLPVEVAAKIICEVLLSTDDQDDPRPLLRQLHALGQVNKGSSVMNMRTVGVFPKALQVRIGLAEFAMLSGRLPGLLNQLSHFIARRIGLDDPQWQEHALPADCEPRWGHTKSVLPEISRQAQWRNLIELHPENLQELTLPVNTALEEASKKTLAGCSELHTVCIDTIRKFPVHFDAPFSLDRMCLDWLDSLPKLQRLEVRVPCIGFHWLPQQTRSKLKVLVLKDFIFRPQAIQELNSLPLDLELELTIQHELGPVAADTPLSGAITRFRYLPQVMQRELLQALPLTLRTLRMMADDAVLGEALERFKALAELELVAPRDANLEPLRDFVGGEACHLRHLTVHVSSKEAKLLIDALKKNRSLETIAIGALTTQPSLKALNALITCHPMKSLTVWLGGDQATPERIRPMLEAIAASRTLRSFTLNASHGITAVLQDVVNEFKLEDCGLLDFSANFGKWSIKKRSLKFRDSEKPAPQEVAAVNKRRRARKKS